MASLRLFAARAPLLRTPVRAFSTTPQRPLAKITIVGRLAADPELAATSTGQDMVRFTVATSYGPLEDRKTSWWRVVSFRDGKSRERLLGLQKGSLVYVEGDASMRQYETKEGKQETALSVVHQSIHVLSRPAERNESERE